MATYLFQEHDTPTHHLYARVSSLDQDLAMQRSAFIRYLDNQGVKDICPIYAEKRSGKDTDRSEFQMMLAALKPGDTVVVFKLDRLSRSVKDLIEIAERFKKQGIFLVSLHEQIDTSTPQGMLFYHILAAFAQFMRENIAENVKEGVHEAMRNGVKFGPKPKLSAEQIADAQRMLGNGCSYETVARQLKISAKTLYRVIPRGRKL